jgi:hypothetical protein
MEQGVRTNSVLSMSMEAVELESISFECIPEPEEVSEEPTNGYTAGGTVMPDVIDLSHADAKETVQVNPEQTREHTLAQVSVQALYNCGLLRYALSSLATLLVNQLVRKSPPALDCCLKEVVCQAEKQCRWYSSDLPR